MTQPKIAIIGSGISGLTLAQELTPHAEITLFEKSRGVGGRMATRRAGRFEFDHGTQFFTAKSTEFQAWLEPRIQQGLIAEWSGNVISIDAADRDKPQLNRPWPEPHYVAVPAMNSLAKNMAQHLNIVLNTQVARLPEDSQDPWHLSDIEGNLVGKFDWVISTAPPAQTIPFFADHLPHACPITQITMQGCYTLMLGFEYPLLEIASPNAAIAARIRNSPIEWIAVNSTKPGRDKSGITLVAHSSNAWAQEHIDDDQEQTQTFLLSQLEELIQFTNLIHSDIGQAGHTSMHRWRYALKPSGEKAPATHYLDPSRKLAATGDWSSASRIEDVWLSARTLATNLLAYL